jgi:transposase
MPRPGLRLSEAQIEHLSQEYQVRAWKDIDMALRIQALLLVSQGMGELRAAQIVGVGRRTLQEWIFKYRAGGLVALVKGPYPGRKPKLTDAQLYNVSAQVGQNALKKVVGCPTES